MNPLFHTFFQQYRFLINHLNEALKEHGLFSSQWTILFLLNKEGPMTLTAIWKYLNVEAPTITRTVTRLEKLGLVRREEGVDRREKIVHLTESALLMMPEVEASVLKFEAEMTKSLTEEETAQLIHLLNKMKG
ncbi:MarR family winged helix-turn-helix transcriptional regulator [Lysinibacillus odysseyi]|uniref:MarR family transcriptional regulator n=1 Tax=Lysinibacillus odysseyi 34hs-1 = NBRC 100172 TaxID=1220589 RepID=A0A0A3IFX3_9BACI|nr:MarR family transcriptional regulator [Lysinibacillus odysseyi]KGR81718.1 MarR family transcriptional regulator [Lysinibacillus odysseyi 34hs-1 = NBRC 100172]